MAESNSSKSRVTRHRRQAARAGARRVEVTVPSQDTALVKAAALALRNGGAEADKVRSALEACLPRRKAETGADLVAFLRASPLVSVDLEIERDRSAGRSAQFE